MGVHTRAYRLGIPVLFSRGGLQGVTKASPVKQHMLVIVIVDVPFQF